MSNNDWGPAQTEACHFNCLRNASRLNPASVSSRCFHVDIELFQGGHYLVSGFYSLIFIPSAAKLPFFHLASSILLTTSFFGPLADGLFEVGQLVRYTVLLMAFMPSEEEVNK